MTKRHFYNDTGSYSKDPIDKEAIENISKQLNDFIIPMYEKYRDLGYPAIEITQVIEDQLEFGLVHHRLLEAAKEEHEKSRYNN